MLPAAFALSAMAARRPEHFRMSRRESINRESFEALLGWLDQCRDAAGQKYELIRHSLIKIFIARGSHDAEDLADMTINRVVGKLPEIKDGYVGDPAVYFYGVARNVLHESRRRKEVAVGVAQVVAVSEEAASSTEVECLRNCLALLPEEQRELMLDYYLNTKRLKIEHHKRMAEELGLSHGALRLRAHRIRGRLEDCVRRCANHPETN
ncbi:MAG: sigma-70 family RNA polymerase sigma factor [Pyrinomonadaceae bacterium]